ncbi:carboxymuconolactone decarboxylase family protein [Desulfitobacterium sp.]|uniref:carboxymuconolactone decarboxylase family protein n=1 Tax=Desulfitobacterium sp. TaxID=49981 RepID=UPI002D1860C1|nr:carboxymuconolactone decarboxylase family protein [Desulfitobacterium sp.]HVJ49911.1 carboxymuconolactone decarboxylase family protein [Desulfitobacterium sp.]
MTNVKLISEQEADGEVKAIYEQVKQMMGGVVPPTFQAMANHPEYMKMVFQKMQMVMGSPELDKSTKLAIAFAVSVLNNCEMCLTMYTKQLKDAGFTDKQLVEILAVIDLVGSMNHFNNGMLIKPEK